VVQVQLQRQRGGDCVEIAYAWRKSSHSGSDGGDCVEVAAPWRKSTHSGSQGGDCVEVAAHPAAIHVRTPRTPRARPHLHPGEWAAFTAFAAE